MIVLDTNVISEMMRKDPSSCVKTWLDAQSVLELYITSVTVAEILYGLEIIPQSKRRIFLENAFCHVIKHVFQHRILAFDEKAASSYANIMAHAKRIGKPMSVLDGQIAAITLVHEGILATRNIRDFQAANINLINPFEMTDV